jgi:hypothetical protein
MWKTISSRDDVQEIVAQIRSHWPHTLITGHASKLSVWILCVRAMELVRCAYTGGECLLWVKTSHCLDQTGCQKRTHALQQFVAIRSPGRVGTAKHRKRYGKAKCLTGFQIERWKGISIDKNFKFDAAQQLPASCKLFQF